MAFVLVLIVSLLPIYLMVNFTADEAGYVLGLIVHHAVHIPFLAALLLNFVFNGVALTFDVGVWVLRVAGVI